MKSLTRIFLVLLTIAILFFLLGIIVPTQTSITEIEVQASPDHCWNVYHDSSLTVQWIDDFIRVEAIGDDELKEGNQFNLVMKGKGDGQVVEILEIIGRVDRPNVFEMNYTNDFQNGDVHVEFAPTDKGTLIISKHNYTGKNVWLKSLLHFMKQSVDRSSTEQYEKLKNLVENTPINRYHQDLGSLN